MKSANLISHDNEVVTEQSLISNQFVTAPNSKYQSGLDDEVSEAQWEETFAKSHDMILEMVEEARASDKAGMSWSLDKLATHESCGRD